MKKILSVLLVITLLLTSVSTGLLGFAGYTPDVSKKRVEIEVDPGQTIYQWGDEIVFDVDVKNNTGSAMEGIEIRSEAYRKNIFATVGESLITIDELEAGESTRVQFRYQAATPNLIQKCIVFPIYAIFDFLAPLKFKSSSFDKVEKLRVGSFTYRFGFDVYDGKAVNNTSETGVANIKINEGVLITDASTGLYMLNADIISGTANKNDVTSIKYRFTDDKNILIYEGIANYEKGAWSFEDFSLRDGINKLTLYAYNRNQKIDSLSLEIYSSAFINSENSLIDTNADPDGDGLIDYLEQYYGSDPTNVDTDDDGLTDYTEVYYLGYDPKSVDTDKNSVNDADEDADNDGLSNLREQEIGTNPAYYDTDHDSISDYDEVTTYNTDPLNADTDGDGVDDATEVLNGSNPLVGETSFTTNSRLGVVDENNPVAVEAVVKTDAEGAGTLRITEVSASDNVLISKMIPGYLGSAFDFTTDGEFEEATLTFYYDTALGTIGDDFQPCVYYVNETTGEFEEIPNQIIENGKVTVKVEHFSTYILLNKVAFDIIWNAEIKAPITNSQGTASGIDVIFVIDVSGSMDGSRLNTAKAALNTFLDALGQGDRAALVKFESSATILSTLTDDIDSVKSKVSSLYANGGTAMYKGLDQAINQLSDSNENYGYKMIIMLSDGQDEPSTSYSGYYQSRVDNAVANNITIYTIGAGTSSTSILTQVAENTGGAYYAASVTSGITEAFDKIKQDTVDVTTDSNNDKLSDYYTDLLNKGDLTLSNGTCIAGVTDYYGEDNADWDGDGLLNGEEIVIEEHNGKIYAKMKSHPLFPDYDNDGYNDLAERNMGTNPFVKTMQGGSMIENLIDDSMSTSSLIGNHSLWDDITLSVYADKKKDAKNKLATFFYKYASEESIKANAEAIKKAEIKSSIYDTIEMLTNLGKLGKNIADLSVKYEVNQESEDFKNSVKEIEKQRGYAIDEGKKVDESSWDKIAKKEKDILGIITSWDGYIEKLQNAIEDKKSSTSGSVDYDTIIAEINNDTKLVNSAISAVKNAVGFFKLWKASSKPIGKTLTKVSEYAAKTSAKDAFKLKTADFIDIGFAVADYANEVMDTADTFSRVQANSEAFTDYYDLLYYIDQNNNYDYIRDSAGEVLALALGGSAEYWNQLEKAAGCQFAKDFIKEAISLAINAVSKTNPVIAVLKAILDIAVGELNAVFKVEIEATTVDAITDACKAILPQFYDIRSNGAWVDISDETQFYHYLVHLIHGRVDGENIVYSHCDEIGLFSKAFEGWRILFTGRNRIQETKDNCKYIIQQVYKRANYFKVKYSNSLPFYAEYHSLTF